MVSGRAEQSHRAKVCAASLYFPRFNASISALASHIQFDIVTLYPEMLGSAPSLSDRSRKCNQRGMLNAVSNFPNFRTRQSVPYPTIRDNNDRSGSSGGKPRKVPEDVSWTTMMQLHELGFIG